MGNVPISCCRTKSPRLDHNDCGSRNGIDAQYSSSSEHHHHEPKRKLSNRLRYSGDQQHPEHSSQQHQQPSHILQHISEREPDDSETDPSSNPLNRPIFATRSSSSRKNRQSGSNTDTHSSNNSNFLRKQFNTQLTCSQDQGYNSSASTNFTNYDCQLTNSSFENSIWQQASSNNIDQNDGLINSTRANSSRNSDTNAPTQLNSDSEQHDDNVRTHMVPGASNRFYLTRSRDQSKSDYEEHLKASSCSTIFIDDSTISQPNLDQTIRCVSLAIYYHIKNRTSEDTSEIFDESIHPMKTPICSTGQQDGLLLLDHSKGNSYKPEDEPDQAIIYHFVNTLFKAAQLSSEYAITTLVYLERLMTYTEMDLTPKTWRRMFLGAILLSSKVWEDQAVWNVDYAQILEEISVDDINELERQFLELIQFNMNVPSSVYAKYYFHLRTLALSNGCNDRQTLMTIGKAKNLEAMSRVYTNNDWVDSPIHRKSPPSIKKHTSLERLRISGRTRAVLM